MSDKCPKIATDILVVVDEDSNSDCLTSHLNQVMTINGQCYTIAAVYDYHDAPTDPNTAIHIINCDSYYFYENCQQCCADV